MDYYLICQDEEYSNYPRINNLYNSIELKPKEICDYKKIEDKTTLKISDDFSIDYLDWVDKQILLVSSKMKEIMEIYERYIKFKTVVLHEQKKLINNFYYVPMIKISSCLSKESIWNMNKSEIKKIVLNKENLPVNSIFQIGGVNTRYYIARLDLVESLLRRNIEGIKFEKVEIR